MGTDKYHIQVSHHLRVGKNALNEYDQYAVNPARVELIKEILTVDMLKQSRCRSAVTTSHWKLTFQRPSERTLQMFISQFSVQCGFDNDYMQASPDTVGQLCTKESDNGVTVQTEACRDTVQECGGHT